MSMAKHTISGIGHKNSSDSNRETANIALEAQHPLFKGQLCPEHWGCPLPEPADQLIAGISPDPRPEHMPIFHFNVPH